MLRLLLLFLLLLIGAMKLWARPSAPASKAPEKRNGYPIDRVAAPADAYPPDIVESLVAAAGRPAEPLYVLRWFLDPKTANDPVKIESARFVHEKGIAFTGLKKDDAFRIQDTFVTQLRQRGLLLFATNAASDPDNFSGPMMYDLALIHGNDPMEIIRFIQTNAPNQNLDTETIVARLETWNKANPFDIVAAETDAVIGKFHAKPLDLDAFAKDVYLLNPDAIDQGSGTVDAYAEEMEKSGTFTLWWD